nr:LPS export ABC transporter periplasmic protein LptC [Chthonobacter rhizosphaerae]
MAAPASPGPTASRPRALTAERRAVFERAARQSRRVRRLRRALPALGLVLLLSVVAIGVVTRIEIALSVGDVRISAEGLSMDAPKLSGSDGKGRTYEVTAERAVQDLSDPKRIRLYGISATVRQADGRTADFTAGSGLYDAGGQSLVLDEDLTIRGSDGTSADLKTATIDLATGEVESDAPIAFSSSLGSIEAKGMSVGERGGAVTFHDGVRMTVDPNAIRQQGNPVETLDQGDRGPNSEGQR